MDGPDGEYQGYLPEFWNLVSAGAESTLVAEYLGTIEREHIGMQTSEQHRLDIAQKASMLIAAWRIPVRG